MEQIETHLWIVSCFFLSSTSVLCLLGLIAPAYRENLLQNLAMGILMVASASRAVDIWHRQAVPGDWLMVHVGLGLFAYGVLAKVLRTLRRRRLRAQVRDTVGLETMAELSRWHASTARTRDTGG